MLFGDAVGASLVLFLEVHALSLIDVIAVDCYGKVFSTVLRLSFNSVLSVVAISVDDVNSSSEDCNRPHRHSRSFRVEQQPATPEFQWSSLRRNTKRSGSLSMLLTTISRIMRSVKQNNIKKNQIQIQTALTCNHLTCSDVIVVSSRFDCTGTSTHISIF